MIRIRTEQPAPGANRKQRPLPAEAKLTYKGPAGGKRDPSSTTRRPRKSRYKVREELELSVSDHDQMRQILGALRLRPSFRYEKFRTTYALRGLRNLKIEFDETPIGTFLELEGSPSAINRAAELLGYPHSQYITKTYGDLYVAHMRRKGRRPSDMLFSATRKWR